MTTQKQKILAGIAKGIRESGFKGKIIPHMENEQLELHSAYHSDIIYNIRFHFDLCDFFIYRYFNGKWKPVSRKGKIDFDEEYSGYGDWLDKEGYTKEEYIILKKYIKEDSPEPVKKKEDQPDKGLYFGDFFLDDEVEVKKYDSMFDNNNEVKPDSNSLFYQKYAKKKRTI